MKHLTLSLDEEIHLLDRYKLTSNELLVVRVLLILQDNNEEELFHKLVLTLKSNDIQLRDILESLQNKEIVLKSFRIPKIGDSFDPYSIPINKNFIKNLYKSSFELGKELFDEYPQFGIVNNSQVPLRGVSRFFNSLEDAYYRYGKCISWNPETHSKIIELVKWARENNLLNKSLGAFIVDNSWHDLESMKSGEVGNYNFETIREL